MKPKIWIERGVVITYGRVHDNSFHKHYAIQIVWSSVESDSQCQISDGNIFDSFIIDSQVEHKLNLSAGWVLLVEPRSNLGKRLTELLSGRTVISIADISKQYAPSHSFIKDPISELKPLLHTLSLSKQIDSLPIKLMDKRIQSLIEKLDLCLKGECLKPTSWSAAEVASSLSLSESRFIHLFSQQMGIAWRPYLRWRRLSCAISSIVRGMSVTESAHAVGFSDSSHLSRTFRYMFGLSIQQAKSLFLKS